MLGRHHSLEEARFTQRLDSRPAGRIDIVVRQFGERRVGEARERLGKAAMLLVEEGPGQGFLERHA